MAAAPKPANDLFNFGGEIEALRAACLAETGLPAPKPPVWHHVAMAAE
jgi:N-methylhydantoinase B